MTREEAGKIATWMGLWAQGKAVQFMSGGRWWDCVEDCFWQPAFDYRIKPEPREFWVNEFPNEGLAWYPSRDEAVRRMAAGSHIAGVAYRIAVHYREVIE